MHRFTENKKRRPFILFMQYRVSFLLILATLYLSPVCAQHNQDAWPGRSLLATTDSETLNISLRECISYALRHQPAANQAAIDENIARTNKNIALSSWLPQIIASATYQHFLELPTTFLRVNDVLTPIRTGVANTSIPQLAVTQNIFSNDVLLAGKTAKLYMQYAREQTATVQQNLVTNVSKAFYDVLLSAEKIKVFTEDTARLRKNQSDAYHRYVSGVADKVDYKQATISLNNSLSMLKAANEEINGKYAVLKMLMGSKPEETIRLQVDTARLMQDIYADTLAPLHKANRPEYRQLAIARRIQHAATNYYRTGFLPTVSAFYTYNAQFQNTNLRELYSRAYPNSLAGLQLSVPLFTGFRRLENKHKAEMQETRIDWDEVNLELTIYAQYRQAMAAYKSNLYQLGAEKENTAMAREVYDIVKLQYNEGIKTYLDVIIAMSQLQTAEINYQDTLFRLLQSRLDLDRAMGTVPVER